MIRLLKHTGLQLMRFLPHQLTCIMVCLLMFMGWTSPVSAALLTKVKSTAYLTYQGLGTSVAATVDIYAIVATANVATIKVDIAAKVDQDSTSPLTITVHNTGINDLYSGVLIVTPPKDTTVNIPVDPYGSYVATAQNDKTWSVVTPDLGIGDSFDVPATLTIPYDGVIGDITLATSYEANGEPITSANTAVHVIKADRSPAVIEFLHFNEVLQVFEPATVYHAGRTIYIQLTDLDQNIDPYSKEKVTVTLTVDKLQDTKASRDVYIQQKGIFKALKASGKLDSETFILSETGLNTGAFLGGIPSTRSNEGVPEDGVLALSANVGIIAHYQDKDDSTDTAASAVLVDPFGLVFDAASGVPIDGVTISIFNNDTNMLADVVGDDGVSAYPSTLVTGTSATDASGAIYEFASGEYRFPFVAAGNYRFELTVPVGYEYPSDVPTSVIQSLPTGPFAITLGSRAEIFTVQAGPALHIDIPVDSDGANLFVIKKATAATAAIGDRVGYDISVENIHSTSTSSQTTLRDVLPVGFRYQAGSTVFNGLPAPNPTIGDDGRHLSFDLGSIEATSVVHLSYTTVVGANTNLGKSMNSATATGEMGIAHVTSNVAKATVLIREDLIRSRGFIAGTVFVDENMNEIQDEGEEGVQGVRIFMEDGRSVISDKKGRYHFEQITLGSHVIQMDEMTLKRKYQAIGLKQTRFANNDFSQFAEVTGGGLTRANFRLVHRAPEATPVTVKHKLEKDEGIVWATVDIIQGGLVSLSELKGFYILPQGWKYVAGSASVANEANEPEQTPAGLVWLLNPSLDAQRIRFAMQRGGGEEEKEAVAYARFVSPGTAKGRTGLAILHVQDTLLELRDQRSLTLHLKFGTRQGILPHEELAKLKVLFDSLNGLVIRELIVEGHTDNVPISPRNRAEFANNMVLSQTRASTIAAYLQKELHLDEGIVKAVGKGAEQPLASNSTKKGREQNRRVVLKIRADKISHDLSTNLQDDEVAAVGRALGSWLEKEDKVMTAKEEQKTVGILSPSDGMSLPHPVTAVRTVLDSRLTAVLTLDGEVIPDERIGFKAEDTATGKTTYTYIGIDFGKPGQHLLVLKGLGPFGNVRYEESVKVDRTGELAKIKLIESGDNIADGKTPVRFKLALIDNTGVVIRGSLELTKLGGDLLVEETPAAYLLAKDVSQSVLVDTDGWVSLPPVSSSGEHRIVLGYNDIEENIGIYVKPEVRDWILVGFGEGTLGHNTLSGAVQPITDPTQEANFYQDGRIAFYAKGQVSGDFLLTLAYDTQHKPKDQQNTRFGDIDPNVMYTVYGDTTQQKFDATSSEKLYIKLERDTFYALFGDFNTNMTTTELTRYSRSFTGVKTELHEDRVGFSAFATQTSQTMVHDDIRGDGTSGLYTLSRQDIIANTEVIRVETVDRFKSEVILNSIELTRHVDYDIDYVLGTVWFKQPILSRDSELNPIMIRVEYEADDLSTDQFTTAGGRVYIKPHENIEIGGTYVSEGRLGVSDTLSGADLKVKLNDQVDVLAEVAESVNDQVIGKAWKVEARMASKEVSGRAYARKQDDQFGLGQQLLSENSTLKFGADAQYRLGKDSSLNGELFRQEVINTGSQRDMASVQYNKQLDEHSLRVGVRTNKDEDGAGTTTSSELMNIGITSRVSNQLSLRADHEQALSQNNGVDFPTRSSLGSDYRITATTSLTATQEWTKGQSQDTTSTRVGVNTQPWNGAQMSTSYEQQLGEGGQRSFANAGLLQTWELTETLSFSAGLDQTKIISKSKPVQLNLNAPVATGGDDFKAYSIGADYHPGLWIWSNRLEYRISDLSKHHGIQIGVQGSPLDPLVTQLTLRWQKDALTSGVQNLQSDSSLRAAWRPSYDQLILLNRFDIRRSEQTGIGTDTKSLRFINNMTANWQTSADWQLRVNHGIKLSNESIAAKSWTGVSDLIGVQWMYDFNEDWDVVIQSTVLRVRHLDNFQPSAGLAVGYNMFDNFWLSAGHNFVGFYDQDFAGAEYSREGTYMRFRFKYDQHSLQDMLK